MLEKQANQGQKYYCVFDYVVYLAYASQYNTHFKDPTPCLPLKYFEFC